MALKGLRGFRFVPLTKDDEDNLEYEKEITKLIGARSVKITPKTSSAELYGDDQLLESNSAIGAIDVEIDLTGLPLAIRAKLLGNKYENGIMIENKSDNPPEIGFGFLAAKSKKGDRMVWLTKGKAEPVGDESKTQEGDKISYQTQKMKLKFMPRVHDGLYKITADTDEEDAPKLEEFFTTEVLKSVNKSNIKLNLEKKNE